MKKLMTAYIPYSSPVNKQAIFTNWTIMRTSTARMSWDSTSWGRHVLHLQEEK